MCIYLIDRLEISLSRDAFSQLDEYKLYNHPQQSVPPQKFYCARDIYAPSTLLALKFLCHIMCQDIQ